MHNTSVTLRRRSATAIKDDYGMTQKTYVDEVIENVGVAWESGGVTEDRGLIINGNLTFYFPSGTNVGVGDTIVFDGEEYYPSDQSAKWQVPSTFFFLQVGEVVKANRDSNGFTKNR